MPPVSSHMSRDLLTVSPGVPLTEVAKRMATRDVGAVMVVEDERLVGILTERDVLSRFQAPIRDGPVGCCFGLP